MPAYDEDAEGNGAYLVAFIESAGEVSTVFERKIREMAEDRFGTVSAEEWYPLGEWADLYKEVMDEVGENTMKKGGKENGKAIEWPEDVNSVEGALGVVNELHQDSTRNSGQEYPAGRYVIDMQGPRSVRVGITEAFPWPKPFVPGVIEGIIEDIGPEDAIISGNEVEPEANERAAWEFSW
jgi:hypothetical protein